MDMAADGIEGSDVILQIGVFIDEFGDLAG
jgi:hypothetical protein